MKGGWKCVSTIGGEQSVTVIGMHKMQQLFVGSLDSPLQVSY